MPGSPAFGKVYTGMMLHKFFEAGLIRRVVDVGAGSGTYRKLLINEGPGATWVAVEAWKPNIGEYALETLYDEVLNEDVRQVDFTTLGPDLVVFGDVLEHMTKEEAQEVVGRALATARYVMISIPIIHYPQGEIDGNPFERHVKEDWSHNEVCDSFPDLVTCLVHDHIGVYFLSRRPDAIGQLIKVHDVVSPIVQRQFGEAIQLSDHI